MSTQEIKQGTLDVLFGILKTPYALPFIFIWFVWEWLKLTPDEVARIKELQPLLNSSIGVAVAFAIVIASVMIAISYVFSMLKSFKDDLREIFSEPVDRMAKTISAVETKVEVVAKTFEEHIERGERQRLGMRDDIAIIKSFFNK